MLTLFKQLERRDEGVWFNFFSPGCNAELGGFAGLFDLKAAGFIDPILVSGTDGVGTKLKVGLSVIHRMFEGEYDRFAS